MNQRTGKRWSATRAFLDDVRQRPNLTIMTEATVETLILEKQDDGLQLLGCN